MDTSPDCKQIKKAFGFLRVRSDVASLLGLTDKALRYRLYGVSLAVQYRSFELRKKSGGVRTITAPQRPLKFIQHRLRETLECVYEPKAAVHGFNAGFSIKTNAEKHPRSKWVLNVDISEFFPSINFGRVRGMFMAHPYKCTPEVATVLARICCVDNQLPQGAPTSPIISNMLCARLDAHMNYLAGHYKCTYTRYADDMTLSTFQNRFPKDLAEMKEIEGQQKCVAGVRLFRVIRRNGFKINTSKIRLSNTSQRQEVTGLVVNEKVNVPRTFVREVRAMLHNLQKMGADDCQEQYETKYAIKRNRAPGAVIPPFLWVLRGKIEYVGMIRGKDDELYRRLLKRLSDLVPGIVNVPVLKDELDALFEHLWVVHVEMENGEVTHQGTAFMLRGVGLITASHVLGEGKIRRIRIQDADGSRQYEARMLKRNGLLDLAVLEIQGCIPVGGLEASPLTPTRKMSIRLLGFPNHNVDDPGHVDEGIITSVRKNPFSDDKLFLINCNIIYGHSGGPILDSSSRVLGVAVRGAPSKKEAAQTEFHAGMSIAALASID